jgi:hypothetical protein
LTTTTILITITTILTTPTTTSTRHPFSIMSNQRQRKPRGGGIPPELMNVEFNPNDPQALMDADDPDDGIGDLPLNNVNNRMMNGNNGGAGGGGGGGNYNMYGQQQRAYTYKDRPGSLRGDGYGGGGNSRYNPVTNPATLAVQSHNYEPDESEVWRAYVAQVHFSNRGQWWTTGKKRALKRWILTFAVGVVQAVVATSCNFASRSMTSRKYDYINDLLNPIVVESSAGGLSSNVADDDLAAGDETGDTATGSYYSKKYGNDENADGANIWKAFWNFCLIQILLCAVASMFVYIGKYTKIKGNI